MQQRVALVALIALAIARIGGAAHLASARHVEGAAGETIDAPAIDVHAPHGDAVQLIAADGDGARAAQPCAFDKVLHEQTTAGASAPAIALAPTVARADADAPRSIEPALAIYRLAPKTSPPVALRPVAA